MIDFFYTLPIWAATVIVIGLSLAVGLGSSFGLRHAFRLHSSDDEMEAAVSLMQVVAAYIGILIAFAGVQVWQDFSDAENSVHREAAALGLRGWVRNTESGHVEVVAAGDEATLERLQTALTKGSRGSRVDSVVEEDLDESEDAALGPFVIEGAW